jgi:hypothetical protein
MKTAKPTFGAFNQGQVPTIACFNRATVALGVNFNALIAAMQAYVNQHIVPIWDTPAKLIKTTDFVKDAWAMVFLDNADQPGGLAYHDLTPGGLPLSKVFVKTTLADGELVSVSASHELVEVLVDPAINMMTTGPRRKNHVCVRECGSGRGTQLRRQGHCDERFCVPLLLRSLSQNRVSAVRSPQQGQEAISDPFRRLSDHF